MDILAVLQSVTSLIQSGYKGVEIAGILRKVANEIDPKSSTEGYTSSKLPTNMMDWEVFMRDWRACFRRNYPHVQVLDLTHRIGGIKAVREMTGLGLKEAKDFIDANWSKFSL